MPNSYRILLFSSAHFIPIQFAGHADQVTTCPCFGICEITERKTSGPAPKRKEENRNAERGGETERMNEAERRSQDTEHRGEGTEHITQLTVHNGCLSRVVLLIRWIYQLSLTTENANALGFKF